MPNPKYQPAATDEHQPNSSKEKEEAAARRTARTTTTTTAEAPDEDDQKHPCPRACGWLGPNEATVVYSTFVHQCTSRFRRMRHPLR